MQTWNGCESCVEKWFKNCFVGYCEDCFGWCFEDGFKDCSQELVVKSWRLSGAESGT